MSTTTAKPSLSQLVVPHRTPMYDDKGVMTRTWVLYLERVAAAAVQSQQPGPPGPPGSPGAPGPPGPGTPGLSPPPANNGNQLPGSGPGGGDPWDVAILGGPGYDDYTNEEMTELQFTIHSRPANTTGFKVWAAPGTTAPADMSQYSEIMAAPISASGDTVIQGWIPRKGTPQDFMYDVVAFSPSYAGLPAPPDFTVHVQIKAIGTPGQVSSMHVYGNVAESAPYNTAVTAVIGGLPSGHFKFQYITPGSTLALYTNCTGHDPSGNPVNYDCNFFTLHVEVLLTDSTYTALPGKNWVDTFGIPTLGNPAVWEQTDWFPLNTTTPIYCQVRWRSHSRAVGTPTEWSAYSTPVNVMFPAGNGLDLTQANTGTTKLLSPDELINGSFEQGLSNWAAAGTGLWVLDQTNVQAGQYSIKFVTGGGLYPSITQHWGGTATNSVFAVEGWCYSDNWGGSTPVPQVLLRFYQFGSPPSTDIALNLQPQSGGWAKSSTTITAPNAAYSLDVFVYLPDTSSTGVHWWVDSVRVYIAPNATALQGLGATIAVENNALVVKSASLALQQMLPGGFTDDSMFALNALKRATIFNDGVIARSAIIGNGIIIDANIGSCAIGKLEAGSAVFTGAAIFASGYPIQAVTPVAGGYTDITCNGHGLPNGGSQPTLFIGGFVPPWDGLNTSGTTGIAYTWQSSNVVRVQVDTSAAGAGSGSALGTPALTWSTKPNVTIQSSGITMNNSQLSINVTSGGSNYSLLTGPAVFDSSYGSLAINIQGTSTNDSTMFISRGMVAYYGPTGSQHTRIALVRDPGPSTNGGQLILYDTTNNESVFLNGSTGELRGKAYVNVTNGQVIIDGSGTFLGGTTGGVNCGQGIAGTGFNINYAGSTYYGVNWQINLATTFTVSASPSSSGSPAPPSGTFSKLIFKGGALTGVA